jgi:hypothetical protein
MPARCTSPRTQATENTAVSAMSIMYVSCDSGSDTVISRVSLPGSAADAQGTPASFRAPVIRRALYPASRWANIHVTTCPVSGSGHCRDFTRAVRPVVAGSSCAKISR